MAKQECRDVATEVLRIHAVGEALTKGWHFLYPDRRAETLARLRKRVDDLVEAKQLGSKEASAVMDRLETLDRYNGGEGTIHNVSKMLLPAMVDMAVDAIADCECGEARALEEHTGQEALKKILKPTRYDVKLTKWEERDRLHIGIVDKETEQISYADWWDEDARQMFEDGFFVSGKGQAAFENSVLDYAEDMGILAK